MSSTGTASAPMHQLHHGLQRFDRRIGEDAVAEVEDVAGPAPGAAEDVAHSRLERGARSEQRRGVQVPLDRLRRADALPRRVQRDAPIDADHVAARRREVLEEARGAGAEVDHGDTGGSAATCAASRIGRAIAGPSPAVKARPSPSGSNGSRMSANRMAASTPSRATGCNVTWAASSGWWHSSRMECLARSARYSGM